MKNEKKNLKRKQTRKNTLYDRYVNLRFYGVSLQPKCTGGSEFLCSWPELVRGWVVAGVIGHSLTLSSAPLTMFLVRLVVATRPRTHKFWPTCTWPFQDSWDRILTSLPFPIRPLLILQRHAQNILYFNMKMRPTTRPQSTYIESIPNISEHSKF